jgi:GNAT superfamily N-acetyltransferase
MTENSELIISTDKSLLNIEIIHGFLSESYWAKARPLEVLKKAIENSLCFGVYLNNSQIGFARVVTDYSTFAYLADVFILEEFRGKGYSKQLIEKIISYPDLQSLNRWMLATKDAHTLYSKFGFKMLKNPERFMEITR